MCPTATVGRCIESSDETLCSPSTTTSGDCTDLIMDTACDSSPTPAEADDLPGDANCDGRIDASDVLTVLHELDSIAPVEMCVGNADVNHDGKITAEDSLLLLEYW
jgi:hypothetical protein